MTGNKVLSREDAYLLMSESLVDDDAKMRREYSRRSDFFDYAKVPHSDVKALQEKGWETAKVLKRETRLRRRKKFSAQLEDDVWAMLRRAGYAQMNKQALRVPFEREDGSVDRKQVDVYARDDETVLIIECKAREQRGRRSLQKDLAETKSFKSQMSAAIRTFYGDTFKPKIVWIYATRNIIWSENDIGRATEVGVKILTENELNYYDAFIKHMGPAGRFQMLAEFLEGQKIPELEGIQVPAIRGKLGGATYFAFVTTPRHLLKISFVNHLALNHPDGRPAYQRMVKNGRLKKIGEFISNGGFFPTNLLINFVDECRFDLLPNKDSDEQSVKFGLLTLPCRYKSAWIIDGQHRLYGYSFLDQSAWDHNIFVLAFEKLDNRKEAELFITINHEQKSVPKSILVSLQADLKWGSDNAKERMSALTSALVKSLAADMTSPLGQRFVVEGVSATENQSLTVPEAAKGVERSRLVGRFVNGVYAPGPLSWKTDDETLSRAKRVINGYFENIRCCNPLRWEAGRSGFVATNPGVRAHLLLLAEILADLAQRHGFVAESSREEQILGRIQAYLKPVCGLIATAPDEKIYDLFSRKFGEGGVKDYFFALCELVSGVPEFKDFGPAEFKQYRAEKFDARYSVANTDVMTLARKISDYIYETLLSVHGSKRVDGRDEAYWELGIESAKAKMEAYNRQQQDQVDKRLHKFAYLDILPLRDIVKQANNWTHFEPVFNIRMPDENNGKKYYLQWMEDFNELRRISAHPSKHRPYKEADYEFIEWLKASFYSRLAAKKAG
ncbi:DGQHR domain-containing protein [Metallibacterium sp.]|uniref:DGQHR domain-containing protein n=1 Tax=Metallibacterium sp. TaxID=2940281 RepID=UPI00260DC4F7|nr:DGQHR domain-containing protein [Metallibacterium sp.]